MPPAAGGQWLVGQRRAWGTAERHARATATIERHASVTLAP